MKVYLPKCVCVPVSVRLWFGVCVCVCVCQHKFKPWNLVFLTYVKVTITTVIGIRHPQ